MNNLTSLIFSRTLLIALGLSPMTCIVVKHIVSAFSDLVITFTIQGNPFPMMLSTFVKGIGKNSR